MLKVQFWEMHWNCIFFDNCVNEDMVTFDHVNPFLSLLTLFPAIKKQRAAENFHDQKMSIPFQLELGFLVGASKFAGTTGKIMISLLELLN